MSLSFLMFLTILIYAFQVNVTKIGRSTNQKEGQTQSHLNFYKR